MGLKSLLREAFFMPTMRFLFFGWTEKSGMKALL